MEENNSSKQARLSDPATWVDQHGDYLYKYALSRIRNKAVAEDVVQETFLAALKARDNFAGKSSEKTWLVGILKRKIVDHFRRSGREVDIDKFDRLLSEPNDDYQTSGPEAGWWKTEMRPGNWSINAHDIAERKEFWEFLQQCLDGLHPRLAIMFVLREMEEMKGEEICNVLELTPTNLRVMLYRARKDLRRCLEQDWMGREEK